MRTALLLLLLRASSLIAAESPKGTICFGTDCAPATGATFEVKPADIERLFVWVSNDGARVVLGTLAAKAVSIDLESKDAGNVTLSVRGNPQRGWPLETRFAIAETKDRIWRWSVPAKLIGKTTSIRVRPGSYSMQIGAEHHKSDRRPLKVAANDLSIPQITLAPLPAVTGRVVTMKKTGDEKEAKETPVGGAQVARSDGKIVASTNEQGVFRAELIEPFKNELVITSAGFGNRVVPLNILAPDTDLGVIALRSGVKLTTHIDRGESVKSKTLHVKLTEASKTEYENTSIAVRELKPGEDELVFSDLSAEEYYLTLNGEGALEKLTTTIPIKSEDVSTEIHLAPFQLRGSVHLGDEPLHEGKVGINDRHHTWSAEAPIDGEGRFGGAMWQTDGIGGWVNSKETGTLPIDRDPTLTGDPASWDITFRRRLISGKIFDADTKEPIKSAGLHMQLEVRSSPKPGENGMSRLYATVPVNEDGTYVIVATRDGVYDLSASAPEHVDAQTTTEITDRDESKTVDFPLGRGIEQIVDFVWPGGEPVGNAMVMEGVARDGHNAVWNGGTDAAGRLKLRMRASETKTLFIVPKEGSFAPVHLVADDGKPMRIVVPQPVGSLVLQFQDAEKKPVTAGAAFRWNGEWVPMSVVLRLHTSRVDTGSLRFMLLPAGAYEIWGVSADPRAFTPPRGQPVRVGLSAGEQTVEIVVPK